MVVKTGRWAGVPWALTAYLSEQDGICIAMTPEPPTAGRLTAAMGCSSVRGVPFPSSRKPLTLHWISYLQSYSFSQQQVFPDYIAGPAAKEVTQVDVVLADGRAISTTTVKAPKELPVPLRFYVVDLPLNHGAVRALVARDDAGKVLEPSWRRPWPASSARPTRSRRSAGLAPG